MKKRHLFPILVLLFAVAAIAYLWISGNTIRVLGSLMVAILAGFLLLLWFAFFSKFRGRVRVLGTLLVLTGVGAFLGLFRYEETGSGHGFPTFSPRWEAARTLPPIAYVSPSATGAGAAVPATSGQDDTDGSPGILGDSVDFLGPARDGVIPGINLSADWKTNPPREVWRIGVGKGWSGFAVANGKAITQEERDGNEMVVCYDNATGVPLWAHTEESVWSDPMGGDGPRGTPVIHDGRVYALGARGRLHCLDLTTGKAHWNIDSLGAAKPLVYGQASAPLVVDGLVVVPGGLEDTAAIRALQRRGRHQEVGGWQAEGELLQSRGDGTQRQTSDRRGEQHDGEWARDFERRVDLGASMARRVSQCLPADSCGGQPSTRHGRLRPGFHSLRNRR